MNNLPSMTRRAYRPGVDGDPERVSYRKSGEISAGKRPLFFWEEPFVWPHVRTRAGSKFEPAHRQRVHVEIRPSGKVELAVYDRVERSFHIWLAGEWLDIGTDPVAAWSQLPPRPREGLTAEQMYG